LAVGAGLKVLGDKINEAVEKAVGGGLILEIQAGGQMSLAIQQAQQALDAQQNKFFNDLTSNEQQSINSLVSATNSFLTETNRDLSAIVSRAQAAVHNLPFSKSFPQAWRFSPSYFERTPGNSDVLMIKVDGDFYDLPTSGLDSTLTTSSGKNYKNTEKSSQEISFEIPMTDLAVAQDRPLENKVSVAVPYYDGGFLGWFKHEHEAIFKGLTIAVPQKLVDVQIAITTPVAGTITQNKVSVRQRQGSDDDDIKCGGEHADLAIHVDNPDPGWTVNPTSVTWQKLGSQGNEGPNQDYWLERNCSTPLVACLCVSTEYHRFGTSGKVDFLIVYSEYKSVVTQTPSTTKLQIGWGESRVVTIPIGATWTGTYTAFNGKILQFAGPFQDPLVSVTQSGNIVTTATAPYLQTNLAKMGEQRDLKSPKR
jgi:hypothetical protein